MKPGDPEQPVAYDTNGRPLYAHPQDDRATAGPVNEMGRPAHIHFSRAVDPVKQEVSPEVQAKHEESVRLFPDLNLSEGEFVISAVRRHLIGLLVPVGLTAVLIVMVLIGMVTYPMLASSFTATSGSTVPLPDAGGVTFVGLLLIILFAIGGYVAVWVYQNNKFFLTNESVIQEIQTSVFTKNEQSISLINIEDASFQQNGIIQSLLNYGSIRLSTQGEETTYRFHYVKNPKEQIALLNNAVEAFKNGRPIDDN
jgi:hypothetical protein